MKQTILLLLMSALFVIGCAPAVPDTAKEESQCPYCNKNFPSGQIMVHKLNCPKNPTD
ncbi:MAG: hypothetical protein QF685_09305 [Verrucomicrobiota bacterium]|nr:hypothetical protein [Verrucomicrobiota bacterium]